MALNTSYRGELKCYLCLFSVLYVMLTLINCGKYFQSRLITSSRSPSRRGVRCYFICESWNMECETGAELPSAATAEAWQSQRGVGGAWAPCMHIWSSSILSLQWVCSDCDHDVELGLDHHLKFILSCSAYVQQVWLFRAPVSCICSSSDRANRDHLHSGCRAPLGLGASDLWLQWFETLLGTILGSSR